MHELLYLHEQNASESTPTDHPTLKCQHTYRAVCLCVCRAINCEVVWENG